MAESEFDLSLDEVTLSQIEIPEDELQNEVIVQRTSSPIAKVVETLDEVNDEESISKKRKTIPAAAGSEAQLRASMEGGHAPVIDAPDNTQQAQSAECTPRQPDHVSVPSNTERFQTLQTSQQLQQRILKRIPKSTRSASSWAVTIFREWRLWRNWQEGSREDPNWPIPPLSHPDLDTLDYWLAQFIMEVTKKDGSPYPPGSLTSIAAGLQRHMRDELGRSSIWLLKKDHPEFKTFRDALDARRKELIATGMGTHPKRADVITEQDERQLWDSGILNTTTAKGLSYGVYFYNCKIFGFRARDEHASLEVTQYTLAYDMSAKKDYLVYHGRLSKQVTGSNHCTSLPRMVRHFASPSNPRCIVSLFRKYLDEVPREGRFYRRPLPNLEGKISFSLQCVGVHTLDKYLPKMCAEAGISMEGRYITGHSGKATCCTRLFDQGIDEQAIATRSGHKSLAIRNYKRESTHLQEKVSDILQPPLPSSKPPNGETTDEGNATFDLGLDLADNDDDIPLPQALNVPKQTTTSLNPMPGTAQKGTFTVVVPDHITKVVVKRGGHSFIMEFE